MKRRLATLGAAVVATSLVLAGLVAGPAQAHAKIHCNNPVPTGYRQIDPIVNRGAAQSAHQHMFIGSKFLSSSPDPTRVSGSELQTEPTACSNTADHAAYWIPSLRFNGTNLDPLASIAYYRCFGGVGDNECASTSRYVERYPSDLRVVAGNANATSAQPTTIVRWNCAQVGGNPVGPFTSPAQANCESRVPSNVGLVLHVFFPTCWDGVLNNHTVDGNTADFSGSGGVTNHLAYPSPWPSQSSACPAGFGHRLPALDLEVRWQCPANSGSWSCESNNVTFSNGSAFAMHADFLNGWTASGLQTMISTCINTSNTTHPHGNSSVCGT